MVEVKIMSFNVNGLRSLDKYIKEYKCNKNYDFNDYLLEVNYDIYCFQEIKGSKDNLEKLFTLRDYCAFASFHKQPGRHGVMTLVRKNGFCFKTEEIDKGRILKTTHNGFVIYNCYMPYCSEDAAPEVIIGVYEKLQDVLEKDTEKCIFVCGDLNATYNMSDNYIYQQEYEKIVYIDKFTTKILKNRNNKEIEKTCANQLIKVWDDVFYKKLCELSENGIYTDKIRPNHKEMPVYYLTVSELYKRFLEKRQRKWLFDLVKEFKDVFRSVNTELFQYTCWDQQLSLRSVNLGTRIDYILMKTTENYKIDKAEIKTDIFGSDHCPVTLEIDIDLVENTRFKKNLLSKPRSLLDFFNKQ